MQTKREDPVIKKPLSRSPNKVLVTAVRYVRACKIKMGLRDYKRGKKRMLNTVKLYNKDCHGIKLLKSR